MRSVPLLPCPVGLGASEVLAGQVSALAGASAVLQRELALRMAALEGLDAAADPRGDAVRAGLAQGDAARLRRWGRFAAQHPDLAAAWRDGRATGEQVGVLQQVAGQALPDRALEGELVAAVLPHLPGLGPRDVRRLARHAADILAPGDPDRREERDHEQRDLSWASTPGGGIVLSGYLPAAEADAFTRAITALAEDLRAKGDGLTPGQRRADALAALTARAAADGLPSGGGLPAVLTVTVGLSEAARVAAADPANRGGRRPAGSATTGPAGGTGGGRPAGDAAVRFALCCAAVTPLLHDTDSADDGSDADACGSTADAGSLLARIAATRAEPLAVGRAVRLATPSQRRALQLRDGGCVVPGCAVAAAYTQPHHVTGWALDGATDLDNLVSLCFVHHRQAELGRWTFTPAEPGRPTPDGAYLHARWWIRANPCR